jgi:uracil-xanthine permease
MAMAVKDIFSWTEKKGGIIAPNERLPWGSSIALGLQHTLAMFGATVVAPLVMGFPTNTALFFSGIGTLLFFFIVGGNVPSYLGSSFSFISVVITAMGGPGKNLPVALGGIIICGVAYAIIGLITMFAGTRWIEVLMPPAVTGTVVMVIGLNLASVGASDAAASTNDVYLAIITLAAAVLSAVYLPRFLRRLPILIGGVVGFIAAIPLKNVDFSPVGKADWFGLPTFNSPQFTGRAIALIAPIAIVLVAENTGHIKAIGAITGRNLDKYLGRGFLGDAIATIVSGFGGGTGVTTYAENIGVMAMTRVYSTLIFIIASVVAILLGLCPKFGALIQIIPNQAPGILGGLSIVLFGLIAATGGRIWVQGKVDFGKPRTLLTAAIALILAASGLNAVGTPVSVFTLNFGDFQLAGIPLATFTAIILYQILRDPKDEGEAQKEEAAVTAVGGSSSDAGDPPS